MEKLVLSPPLPFVIPTFLLSSLSKRENGHLKSCTIFSNAGRFKRKNYAGAESGHFCFVAKAHYLVVVGAQGFMRSAKVSSDQILSLLNINETMTKIIKNLKEERSTSIATYRHLFILFTCHININIACIYGYQHHHSS